jgi:hypothetical protein
MRVDDNEAPEMAKLRAFPAPPRARGEWEFVRAGRDGTYWQGSDGLVVRVAAAERERNAARPTAATEAKATPAAPKAEPARILRALGLVLGR